MLGLCTVTMFFILTGWIIGLIAAVSMFFIVTATVDAARNQMKDAPNIQYLKCDATVIKTAGRVNPTYFIMKQANIVGKYANADYEKVIKVVGSKEIARQ